MHKVLVIVMDPWQDVKGSFILEVEDLINLPNNPSLDDVVDYYVKERFGQKKEGKHSNSWDNYIYIDLKETETVKVQEDLTINE